MNYRTLKPWAISVVLCALASFGPSSFAACTTNATLSETLVTFNGSSAADCTGPFDGSATLGEVLSNVTFNVDQPPSIFGEWNPIGNLADGGGTLDIGGLTLEVGPDTSSTFFMTVTGTSTLAAGETLDLLAAPWGNDPAATAPQPQFFGFLLRSVPTSPGTFSGSFAGTIENVSISNVDFFARVVTPSSGGGNGQVPEPGTLLLLGASALAAGFAARKRSA